MRLLVHATTVATNALIEGKTASLGMITTQGFRDILEIGRQIRSRLYDVHLTKPRPLVSRRWSFEVSERLDADGQVLTPLDSAQVRRIARQLKAAGVEAVVCCLLHSYINPTHERQVAAILREEYPEAFLSVSGGRLPRVSRVSPGQHDGSQCRGDAAGVALPRGLETRLHGRGVTAPFYVMQSSGGVMRVQSAKQRPVYMVESGQRPGSSRPGLLPSRMAIAMCCPLTWAARLPRSA